MTTQNPILAAPADARRLTLGESTVDLRIPSDLTGGEFAVVEFRSEPGQGVGVHTHQHEDELVYLLEGEVEVTLGGQTMTVPAGACALLPRGIPHGYTNTGDRPSRLLAVLMPGALDGFFVGLDRELSMDRPHEAAIAELCNAFGVTFADQPDPV